MRASASRGPAEAQSLGQPQREVKPQRSISIGGVILLAWLVAPLPGGLDPRAWDLFFVFTGTIALVIANAMPVLVAALSGLSVAVLTGILDPVTAFSGFSNPLILLIAVAFLLARAVVKSGLGSRIAYRIIARLGGTTLGLGYSLVATDLLIAPAFPSNTARSAVLFPIAQSLAIGTGSMPDATTRKKTGAFLMMASMAGLSISSALWLTAMAANPAGAAIAADYGIDVSFGSWLLASSLPSLLAALLVPYVLYRVLTPEIKRVPEAQRVARERLGAMGPLTVQEWIVAAAFLGLISCWSASEFLGVHITAVAFAGLALLMICGVFTVQDLKREGGALEVFLWFAILYTLSTSLDELGFTSYVGKIVSDTIAGYPWPLVFIVLLGSYVLLHYFFVSQTAHLLALFPVFLSVGIEMQVPPVLMAYMLLFATNFFSCITPQASSANIVFAGSGYLTPSEVYRSGGIVTAANLLIYGVIGSFWILAMF